MKSSLEQTEDSLSTTSEYKKLQIKENNHLFNYIDKLSGDHDVIVTETMIKITYKKALKDQNATDSSVDLSKEGKKNKQTNSENSFLGKTPKPVFHSTPKQPPIENEKKKKYLNGLSLTAKPNNQEEKKNRASHKVQKPSEDAGKNAPGSDKTFLKGDGLMKPKTSISQKKGERDKKKTKGSDKKIEKLEDGVKKKNGIDKKGGKVGGVKREASNTELNMLVKSKKMKISEMEKEDAEEEDKNEGKRALMLVDPELPAGWSRLIRTKDKGSESEQPVVYIVNPQGKKFRFKWKLRQYLQKTNSTLDADQFFFGLYQRPKASSSNPEILENGLESYKEVENEVEKQELKKQDELTNEGKSSDRRELLLFDPDLPVGWKRVIHSNAVNGKKQVHIVSPDGKVFRRRYLLNEYLIKHQFNHNLDRFYFGLYPKKEGNSENLDKEAKNLSSIKLKPDNSSKTPGSAILEKTKITNNVIDLNRVKDGSIPRTAMFEDPNLPEGWKRFIKIRTCGESAGRMEVVIVSPDGRRHRSKKHLEHYLLQNQLKYKINDFDFTVSGKSNTKKRPPNPPEPLEPEPESEPEPEPEPADFSFLSMKKKFTDKPVPEFDINSLKDDVITPEGHMINTVSGLMICSGLSSARNERRQRLPRAELEKMLKSQLSSESNLPCDGGCEIPKFWIERLVKCRTEFRSLESDAVSTIAKTTEEFIKKLSLHALTNSQESKTELRYEHLAEVVNRTESLSFIKELIPMKITFREYIKLNRPKQFLSFT